MAWWRDTPSVVMASEAYEGGERYAPHRSDVYPRVVVPIAPRPTNLPAEPTAIVGRAAELRVLESLLDRGARLITVLGAAGMGKTRLALRFASEQLSRFESGAWLCDLNEARSCAELCSALAHALDVPLHEGVDQLGRALAARQRVLVVFDNFEQLDGASDLALSRWLAMAPSATFVVTSRRRLALAAEHSFEVGPLPEADAVQLFVARARMVCADYELADADAPHVAAIVRQLDGMPLAIELAAARLRLLSPQQLRAMLRDLLLESGDRQRTLRGALDWSWSLLTPTQQSALAQCAVFRGGWDLEAARHVLALPSEHQTLAVLEALRDHSLIAASVSPRGDKRYRLYESVREYAAAKLVDADSVRRRHALYYANIDCPEDKDNLLAVVEHVHGEPALNALVTLEPIFERDGPIGHYAELLERALAHDEPVSEALRARALTCYGRALGMRGAWSKSARCLHDALEIAERAGEHACEVRAATALAWACATQGQFAATDAAFERAERALERSGYEPALEAHLSERRGHVNYRRGDRAAAERDLQRALLLFRSLGARREEAFTLGWLGFMADGRPGRAIPYLRRATRILAELADHRQHAWQLHYLAFFEMEVGDHSAAETHFETALFLQRRVGDRPNEAVTLSRYAMLALEQDDPLRALERLERALVLLDESGDLLHRGEALALLGAAEAMLGLVHEAAAHFDEAEALLRSLSYPCLGGVELLRLLLAPRMPRIAEADFDWSYGLTRFGRKLLERTLERTEKPASLRVAADYSWFEGRKRADLSRRPALRRILEALVVGRPSRLSVAELLDAGWPGETCVGSSGDARVYQAVARLRRLGLDDVLHHDGAGYRLVCDVAVDPLHSLGNRITRS